MQNMEITRISARPADGAYDFFCFLINDLDFVVGTISHIKISCQRVFDQVVNRSPSCLIVLGLDIDVQLPEKLSLFAENLNSILSTVSNSQFTTFEQSCAMNRVSKLGRFDVKHFEISVCGLTAISSPVPFV